MRTVSFASINKQKGSRVIFFKKRSWATLHAQNWVGFYFFNVCFRHGVPGGVDRGLGKSAAGPWRGTGGYHHLLMTGYSLLLHGSIRLNAKHSTSEHTLPRLLLCSHRRFWVDAWIRHFFIAKYGLLSTKVVYSILVEYWDTLVYISACMSTALPF